MSTLTLAKKRSHASVRLFFISSAVFLMILCMIFALIFSSRTTFADTDTVCIYESVQILPGDTLWDIAESYLAEGENLSAYVKEIKSVNHLSSDKIIAGEYLVIPVRVAWYNAE